MNKILFNRLSLFAIIAALGFFVTSCDSEEDELPEGLNISFTPPSGQKAVGEAVTFNVLVVADNRIEKFEVRRGTSTIDLIERGDPLISNNTNLSYTFNYTPTPDDAGRSIEFAFILTDRNGATAQRNFSIEVGTGAADPTPLKSHTSVLMGAQNNTSLGSFLDADNGNVLLLSQARSNPGVVDMTYLVGASAGGQGAVLGSLRDESVVFVFDEVARWSNRADTRFRNTSLSASNFVGIEDANDLVEAWANGTQPDNTGAGAESSSSRVNRLQRDQVFAFRTSEGKHGLVHIAAVESANQAGQMTVNVKIQE
ncbi:MAG: hypothetical protein JJT94_00425 [Bernardetiaceae bacterium]|nr:hypothetical protein [Bernardetiaceae bacterium]